MTNLVDVNVVEDDSVAKALEKTALSLKNKYSKKRKINERALKKKTPLQTAFSIVFDCICAVLVICSALLCFSSINSKLQNVCPTFAGYSNLTIKSTSMVNSGFNVGDIAIIKTVNTDTLHEGDKIAFYVYPQDYMNFDVNTCIKINDEEIGATAYTTSVGSLFGFQSKSIKTAAKSGSKVVFHHIRAVYEDEQGTRWFKTYGSSNGSDDTWYISENMVVGLYDDSSSAKTMSGIISAISSDYGILLILIPIVLLGFIIISECVKDVSLAKLELDCVEEKRKITDPICVKNDVGFNMDVKTKYKILAQASQKEKNEYISLLWKKGEVPNSVRKYYIRKNILLKYDEELLTVNRTCEKMFKDGENPTKIAKYYTEEKARIEEEQRKSVKALKKIATAKN
jgi:hypothetical protein